MSIIDGAPLHVAKSAPKKLVAQETPKQPKKEVPGAHFVKKPEVKSESTAPVAYKNGDRLTSGMGFYLSPTVEAIMKEVEQSQDTFDSATFDPVAFINTQFPTEQSLLETNDESGPSKLDHVLHSCKRNIHGLSDEISKLVRESAAQRAGTQHYVTDSRSAIHDLHGKVTAIRDRAQASERMVKEICKDIRRLDVAKRHADREYDAYRVFHKLKLAAEHFEALASQRAYREVAMALPTLVESLGTYFAAYAAVGPIRSIVGAFEASKKELFRAIFSDFREYLHDREERKALALADSCVALELVGGTYKSDLLDWFIKQQLEGYKMIFVPGSKDAGFETIDKRFDLWKDISKSYRERWVKIFPSQWNILGAVCERFCAITKEHFTTLLRQSLPDVLTLVDALRKTIKFEDRQTRLLNSGKKNIAAKVVGAADEKDPEDEAIVESSPAAQTEAVDADAPISEAERIKRKYQGLFRQASVSPAQAAANAEAERIAAAKELAAKEELRAQVAHRQAEAEVLLAKAAAETKVFQFRGMISSCFTPYMGKYVELEMLNSRQMLEQAQKSETWVPISLQDPRECFDTASHLFNYIKTSMEECTRLNTGALFYDVYQVYKKLIQGYLELLRQYVNSFESIKGNLSDLQYLSLVLCANTFSYCSDTMPGLAASISEQIDAYFKAKIDFEPEQQAFDVLINKAIQMLAHCLVAHISPSYERFSKLDWATFAESAYEPTDTTQQAITYVQEHIANVAPRLAASYQTYLYNQLAQALTARFSLAIYQSRKVSPDGVQQLMIDAKAWLTVLEGVPLLGFQKAKLTREDLILDELNLDRTPQQDGPRKVSGAYLKFVRAEMGKVDGCLKVVGAVKEQILVAYQRLFEKTANAAELSKMLELRVDLGKDDRKAILDTRATLLLKNLVKISLLPSEACCGFKLDHYTSKVFDPGLTTHVMNVTSQRDFKLVRWKSQDGAAVTKNQVIAEIVERGVGGASSVLSSPADGLIEHISLANDAWLPAGFEIFEHFNRMLYAGMCTTCGAVRPRKTTVESSEATPLSSQDPIHKPVIQGGKEYTLQFSQAFYGRQSELTAARLWQSRKLVLVLDIDHTLLHAFGHRDNPWTDDVFRRWALSPDSVDSRGNSRVDARVEAILQAQRDTHVFTLGSETHYVRLRYLKSKEKG